MRRAVRHIWDTHLQGECGVLAARAPHGVELYLTATFAQVTLDPPRIAINPNRVYPIEAAVISSGHFSINVMPASSRQAVLRLMALRRREPDKPGASGIAVSDGPHELPTAVGALRTLYCEVESSHDTGDHTIIIGRVLETRVASRDEPPLMFDQVSEGAVFFPEIRRSVRRALVRAGVIEQLKRLKERLRPSPPADIARTTFEIGGQTREEMQAILGMPPIDSDRRIAPPAAPAVVTKKLGVCVVGVGTWGSFYAGLVRKVSPNATLFVSGRDEGHAARVARAVGADGYIVGLERAVADDRVQAYALPLPHHLHREAVERIAAAGKHALVEKPIANTLEDADAMIRSARGAGTILMVAENMHFRPTLHEAVRRIRAGDIGEPLYFLAHSGSIMRVRGWKAERAKAGGGVLMDMGVHYVRGLRLLMGEPNAVSASRAMQIDVRSGVEDSAQLVLSGAAGWEAHMLLSWSSLRGYVPDIIVAGDKGTLHLWPGATFLDYYPVAPRPITALLDYVRPYWLQNALRRPTQQRERVKLESDDGGGYLGEIREFLAAVSEGRPPASPPEEGRRDVEIVLAAYRSKETGTKVAITG